MSAPKIRGGRGWNPMHAQAFASIGSNLILRFVLLPTSKTQSQFHPKWKLSKNTQTPST